MSVQFNKIFTIIVLLSVIFVSCPSKADSASIEWKYIQEKIKDFTPLLSGKGTMESMSPSTIIGLCIAAVLLAIMFRGLILFVIMFGVLAIMFGGPEKAMNYIKGKFNFSKDLQSMDLDSIILKQKENDEKD
jgi:hypothetical protein